MKYRTILFLIGFAITACTGAPANPTVTPPPTAMPTLTLTPAVLLPEGAVLFEEASDQALTGTAYGQGKTAIILTNMSEGIESQWRPFVEAVDKQKFTTITFNYRSIAGASEETGIVLRKLRESGYQRILCIGADLGVASCSSIASEPEIVGLVLIAGAIHRGSLAEVSYPKLFIAGALDQRALNTKLAYEESAEPKKLVLFEDNLSPGTGLFYSKDREQFLTLLLDFVSGLADP